MNTALFAIFLSVLSQHNFVPRTECVGFVNPQVYLNIGILGGPSLGVYMISSNASAFYSDCSGNPVPQTIYGSHSIVALNGQNPVKANQYFNVSTGSWSDFLNTAAVPTWCYVGVIDASAPDVDQQEKQSAVECAPAEICSLTLHIDGAGSVAGASPGFNQMDCGPVQLTAVADTGSDFKEWTGYVSSQDRTINMFLRGDQYITATFVQSPSPGGSGGGPSDPTGGSDGSYNEDLPCFPGIDPNCPSSPIIINFESGNYRLTGANAPVRFDMVGNGHPLLMGWTAAGADEAFLWLDRNHNGEVTSGAELCGNFTPLQNGKLAKNGFEALAEFDANHDGVIDDLDPIWSQLLLWRDLNHNGVCEPGEISRLDASSVVAIDLHDHWAGRHDVFGNAFRYESLISMRNQSGGAVRYQPVYDIFFVTVSK